MEGTDDDLSLIEEFVIMKVPEWSSSQSRHLDITSVPCKVIGLQEGETPMMQVGSLMFEGKFQPVMGTVFILEEALKDGKESVVVAPSAHKVVCKRTLLQEKVRKT